MKFVSLPILVKYIRTEKVKYNYRQIIVLGFYAKVNNGMYTVISCFPATCFFKIVTVLCINWKSKIHLDKYIFRITIWIVHPNKSNEIMLPFEQVSSHELKLWQLDWGSPWLKGIVYAGLQQPMQQWNLGQCWPNFGATGPTLGHVEPTYISVWDPTQIRTKAWLYLE